MHCNIIPDHILKHLKDKHSLRISKKLRSARALVRSLFGIKPLAATEKPESRLTYNTKNTTNLPGELALENSFEYKPADADCRIVHSNIDKVWKFFMFELGRNSLDNEGLPLKSTVHYDKNYNNAFWNSTQMIFGDGDGKFFIPLGRSLDVTGHELTHGIVENTAGLIYYSQPGAANESFADIFGVTIKQFDLKQEDPNKADWLVGNTIVGPEFPGLALRSFKNEKAYSGDTQPKHFKNYSWTLSDSQGVHTNSGILNHAFYQLCIISASPSYGIPIQIMYKTLLRLTKYSGFKTIAKTAREVSKEFGAEWVSHVDKAYKAVGL